MKSMIENMEMQYNALNSILQSYGIKIYLYGVKVKSDVCNTCVEYITVVEFSNEDLYNKYVEELKKLKEKSQSDKNE